MSEQSQQRRVGKWIEETFGLSILRNRRERAMRVMEEAIELAQSEGIPVEQSTTLMRRVYSRPAGNPNQEAAQVGMTLLGWAEGARNDLCWLVEEELTRISAPAMMSKIRAKQTEKHAAGVGVATETVPVLVMLETPTPE